MNLIPVARERSAIMVLYDLLEERTPEQAISHKRMPTLEQHAEFVRSKPYLAWYLIAVNTPETSQWRDGKHGAIVGSIYLTRQREVGIFIFKAHQGKGYGKQAIAQLRHKWPGRLYANVSPRNEASQQFFERMGASLVQYTYELPPVDSPDRRADADDKGNAHAQVEAEQRDSHDGGADGRNEPDKAGIVHGADAP